MTAEQFRAALSQLAYTQVGAGRMLGLNGRTVRHYAKGDREVPAPVVKLLRLALAGKITPQDIDKA